MRTTGLDSGRRSTARPPDPRAEPRGGVTAPNLDWDARRSGSEAVIRAVVLCLCTQCEHGDTKVRSYRDPPTQISTQAPSSNGADSLVPPSPDASQCPADMIHVAGSHCREVEQECIEMHPLSNGRHASRRCLEFEAPSRCEQSSRVEMTFCIDTYEWPNKRGHQPRVLTRWSEAQTLCASRGKRLCYEEEWLFACEGVNALPYSYGYRRDPTVCVSDRMYLPPKGVTLRWERCQSSPKCKAAFRKIDQREPAGSFEQCRSPFGVFDMNGNVNEWVHLRGARYPERSGLKGGWWGPVRNQCRPTVRFHKEADWGYEVGFRCCSDPGSHAHTTEHSKQRETATERREGSTIPSLERSGTR